MVRKPGQSPATASWLFLVGVIAGQLCMVKVSADEICRFAGTTNDAGHVAITTGVAATAGVTRVDVAVTSAATTILGLHIHYLIEEVSTWQAGELESVAVNNRYFVGDDIIRQQWEEFQRDADGLQARRVQGKTLAEFRRRYPGFVQHLEAAFVTSARNVGLETLAALWPSERFTTRPAP
jgi:hypothetical protein